MGFAPAGMSGYPPAVAGPPSLPDHSLPGQSSVGFTPAGVSGYPPPGAAVGMHPRGMMMIPQL